MSIVGVIQARTSSSRLPRKVLLPLGGQSVLWHVIERLRAVPTIDSLVVATSTDESDDAIARASSEWNVRCARGPLDDVLGRFELAIRNTDATTVVRLPADKPCFDPLEASDLIAAHLAAGADYTTNMGDQWPNAGSCPFGLELEVASVSALLRAHREATLATDREHVMPYLYRADHGFRVLRRPPRTTTADLPARLSLDTSEDYAVIDAIYTALFRGVPIPIEAIVQYSRSHPDVMSSNRDVVQRGFQ